MSDYIVFGAPLIGDAEVEAVTAVLRSGWVGTGPRVAEFEKQFRDYIGCRHAVALNSCTAGLHLSMLVAGLQPGDEVITTPLTFAATANAIIHCGARPVFVDVDRTTQNIDPAGIAQAITPRTKAIVPVDLLGRPAALDPIIALARERGLLVVEDAAHCIEGWYHGRKVGTIADLTVFSFYVTKNMTTVEGGMVTTANAELADKIKIYALHGMSRDAWHRFGDDGYRHYEVGYPGFKYNMTDMQAALGLCQLPHLNDWRQRRQELWTRYDRAFANLPVFLPAPPEPDTVHSLHLYTLLIDIDRTALTRDQVMMQLHQRGIGTGVHYRPLHMHPYYRDRFCFTPRDFPNAHWIGERTLSLPLSARVTDEQAECIIRAVCEILGAA